MDCFTVAVSRGWALQKIEINNAFLHGKLNERIVMRQPIGFLEESKPRHVCLLIGSVSTFAFPHFRRYHNILKAQTKK